MNKLKEIIKLDTFQGHIVLLCKNWYKIPKEISFFEALRMIWAIRCGYDYKLTSLDTDAYIANDMWKIINKCCPEKLITYIDNFHREVANQAFWKPKDMTPIQAIIYEYGNIISNIQIRDSIEGKPIILVKLPKPMKQVFNRILRGNGKYQDYELITNADKHE